MNLSTSSILTDSMLDFNISFSSQVESSLKYNMTTNVPEPPLYILMIASIMYGLTFLFGICGNLMVVIVIYRYKTMRSRMNYFLVNLSLSDLLILLLCEPSAAVDLFAKEVWYFGEAMCKIVPFLEQVVTLCSVLTILIITWDRYKGICFPLRYDDGKGMWQELLIIWSASILASIPIAFIPVYRESSFRDGTPILVCRMPFVDQWKVVYIVAIFVIFFIIMLCILIGLYSGIFFTLMKRKTFINNHGDKYAKKILAERKQMILLMLCVVVLFFSCLIPQRAISLWILFASKSQIMSLRLEGYLLLKTFPRVLVYINSAINPIIYNFVSTRFQRAFRNILCQRMRGHKDSTSTPMMEMEHMTRISNADMTRI